MTQIMQLKSQLAIITDELPYTYARSEAEALAQAADLTVADMPMLIKAMATYPEVHKAIREKSDVWIDTITGEYHGLREGERSYEVWHSVGSLATAKGLEKLFSKTIDHSFMPISNKEWAVVGRGSYNGQNVARVHLEDAKKGHIPLAGTPYSIFVRLDRDGPNINAGQLDYSTFMQDDRVLMITGSPENREVLAKMLFGREEEGGEGWRFVGSEHKIGVDCFDAQPKGRLTYLDKANYGLCGNCGINDYGRFIGVSLESIRIK